MRMRARIALTASMRPLLLVAALSVPMQVEAVVVFDWVTVEDPGNAPDDAINCYAADCGSVPYPYSISRYEVTNAQYQEFLSAKAADAESLGLYNTNMGSSEYGGILRSGAPGSYAYAVKSGFADKPVNYVSFFDAMRFANWLHNGQGSADTETGAYTLLGGTASPSNGSTVLRNPGATVFLPSESEWYKAGHYDGLLATYSSYPTGSSTMPTCAAPGATPNTANCEFVVANVTETGAYTGSPSPYGTFDQGGNVWEWNEQIVQTPLARRGVRGASFGDPNDVLGASYRNVDDPASEYPGTGFRVASLVPEPGNATLAAMASLAWLAARRRRSSMIAYAVKRAEAGIPVAELSRQ